MNKSIDTAFHEVLGGDNHPMIIVTTCTADGDRDGCLVGFFTQCSIHPGRFLFCSSVKNYTFRLLQRSGYVAIHFLSEDQMELAQLFGGQTADDNIDKFLHCQWHEGPHGLPILDDVPRWFAGNVIDRINVGDHDAILVEPTTTGINSANAKLMMFEQVKDMEPGHAP